MATRDLASKIDSVLALAPAVHNAAANGTGVDLSGYESAAVVVAVGTVTDGAHTAKVQESDDNAAFTDVAAKDLVGAFNALASNTVQEVSYIGAKRYIRVSTTSSGATGAAISAVVVKSNARHLGGPAV